VKSAPEILFLSHRIPFPPDKGDKIRSHAIVKHLAKRHRVHLACHVDDPADMAHTGALRDMLGGECLFVPLRRPAALARALAGAALGRSLTQGYFASPRIARWIWSLVRRRSLTQAVVYGSAMAPYILAERQLDARLSVLDLVDVDSDKWSQYAAMSRAPRRWLYRYEARQLARLERKAAASFGGTVLVSPYEAASFAEMAPESAHKIHSISNGVDLSYFNPDLPFPSPFAEGQQAIVMTGLMDYWPNVQGAQWFAQMVLPRLAASLPRAHFYVVGANARPGLLAQAGGRVTVTGRVEDVRPYLAHAAVAVAPLQIARGVQNKVLEAMAMRRPVVATKAAARALGVTPGRELSVEDDPARFADAVIAAVLQPEKMALAGRDYVERHHDWSQSLAGFDRLLDANRQAAQFSLGQPQGAAVISIAGGAR
jgi:sugar transferase (PEP-CTERM/EpsH1 system associated)